MSDPNTKETAKRLGLKLDPATGNMLDKLAEEKGMTREELIRSALKTYDFLGEERT